MKTVRGKEMVTLEERFRADMLFYEALHKDTDRFPQWSTRYDIEQVFKRLKDIVDQFNFVDDVRNELNVPTEDTEKGVIDVPSSQ
tara:strand:+ start:151 stop:405 length:255 start_codon:yes stop_codon:yes gene_type:complete